MRALRKQGHQHHQIGKREQPLVGADSGGFSGARNEAQMTALSEIMYVLDANSRQAGYFGIREDLLARLYRNHGLAPGPKPLLALSHYLDADEILLVPTNSEQ